jgi:hypothetical protein
MLAQLAGMLLALVVARLLGARAPA